MVPEDHKQYRKEALEVLLRLDMVEILTFSTKYGITIPSNEISFWAGVHKTILTYPEITEEERQRSANWLLEHGFQLEIFTKPVLN